MIIALPWFGEFGWELFAWQSILRTISKKHNENFLVITRPNREALYEDFAVTLPYPPPQGGIPNGPFYSDEISNPIYDKLNLLFNNYKINGFIKPQNFEHLSKKSLFINYGNRISCYEDCVLIHARNRTLRSSDNFPLKHWSDLVNRLQNKNYRCISIGSRDESHHVPGTIDSRGTPLKELFDMMASAKCIIGPSSGPMHLATLCKCSQIVWSSDIKMKKRYKADWNPFGTKSFFYLRQNNDEDLLNNVYLTFKRHIHGQQ